MLLHDLIIPTVVSLACGAAKAHICAGNGAACRPGGSTADHMQETPFFFAASEA
jgi:hypothetical protein